MDKKAGKKSLLKKREPFDKVSKYMRESFPSIKTMKEFREWIRKEHAKKAHMWIPKAPSIVYEGKGWEGWPKFLGKPQCVSYSHKEVSEYIKENFPYIKTINEFREWVIKEHSKKEHLWIPISPYQTYNGKGWKNWKHFLGRPQFKPYEKTSKYIMDNFPHIQTKGAFVEWIRKEHAKKAHMWIPKAPNSVYKKEDWKGWSHFLKGKTLSFKTYKEVSKYVRENFPYIKSRRNFLKWIRSEHDKGEHEWIPKCPESVYKENEWKGWGHFLKKEKEPSKNSKNLPDKKDTKIAA